MSNDSTIGAETKSYRSCPIWLSELHQIRVKGVRLLSCWVHLMIASSGGAKRGFTKQAGASSSLEGAFLAPCRAYDAHHMQPHSQALRCHRLITEQLRRLVRVAPDGQVQRMRYTPGSQFTVDRTGVLAAVTLTMR